jgi:DNA-binding transcriptional MerR regulator
MYYSIGELSKMLEVNASLLRFWEKEFGLKVSKRNKKGNRLYSVKEIEVINKIYALVKVNGYTLDGAKKALKDKSSNPSIDEKQLVITKLSNIRERLILLKS